MMEYFYYANMVFSRVFKIVGTTHNAWQLKLTCSAF